MVWATRTLGLPRPSLALFRPSRASVQKYARTIKLQESARAYLQLNTCHYLSLCVRVSTASTRCASRRRDQLLSHNVYSPSLGSLASLYARQPAAWVSPRTSPHDDVITVTSRNTGGIPPVRRVMADDCVAATRNDEKFVRETVCNNDDDNNNCNQDYYDNGVRGSTTTKNELKMTSEESELCGRCRVACSESVSQVSDNTLSYISDASALCCMLYIVCFFHLTAICMCLQLLRRHGAWAMWY